MVLSTLFFSQLDYWQIIWANATKKDLNKLPLVQNKAARLALQCPYGTNINSMHLHLNWLRVEDRMTEAILLAIWKVLKFKIPLDRYNQLKCNLELNTYATRQATEGRFSLPKAKTNFLKRTVVYRTMKTWNSLPLALIRITQKFNFKRQVKAHLGLSYL